MPDLTIEQIINQQERWTPLSQRQARETRREVFKLDDRYVIKRFTLPAGLPRYRRPWEIEHRALQRLEKELAPHSLGWQENVVEGQRIVTYVRAYQSGTPLKAFSVEQMPAVAVLFNRLHQCGVITDDANVQNFIVDAEGRLHFIDFGRARVLSPRGPRLLFHIGEEFAKFIREGLNWNQDLWRAFMHAYCEKAGHGPLARAIIQCSFAGHCGIRRIRKTLSGRPAHT